MPIAVEGRRFLFQDFDIRVFGRQLKGLGLIGHLQPLGAEPSSDIWSRAYIFGNGRTLDYVYEMTGRDLHHLVSPSLAGTPLD